MAMTRRRRPYRDQLGAPLEGRCVTRGTTPEQLTAQIAALLETLLTRAEDPATKG
jgi:hypothetical protein